MQILTICLHPNYQCGFKRLNSIFAEQRDLWQLHVSWSLFL